MEWLDSNSYGCAAADRTWRHCQKKSQPDGLCAPGCAAGRQTSRCEAVSGVFKKDDGQLRRRLLLLPPAFARWQGCSSCTPLSTKREHPLPICNVSCSIDGPCASGDIKAVLPNAHYLRAISDYLKSEILLLLIHPRDHTVT